MAEDFSYLGSGIVLIRKWNSNEPFVDVGNVSAFSIAPQTTTIDLGDFRNPGGGSANSVDRVTGYNLSYTFHDFKPDNMARALRGKATTVVAGAIADELRVATKGTYVPLVHLATSITTVENIAGTTEYEEGTDYRFERGMLFIPEGSTIPASVAGAANISVTYQHGEIGRVEAGVTSQEYYEVQFYGANEAQGGKLVRVSAHKVKGGLLETMSLIGNEFGAGTVSGALTKDGAKATGVDVSAYFKWEQQK